MGKRWKILKNWERNVCCWSWFTFLCSLIQNLRWVKLVKKRQKNQRFINLSESIIKVQFFLVFPLNPEIHFFRLTSKKAIFLLKKKKSSTRHRKIEALNLSKEEVSFNQPLSLDRKCSFSAYRRTQISVDVFWLFSKCLEKSFDEKVDDWRTKDELKILNQIIQVFNLYLKNVLVRIAIVRISYNSWMQNHVENWRDIPCFAPIQHIILNVEAQITTCKTLETRTSQIFNMDR